MTRKTIHEYVQGLRPRYLAAGRQGKRTILEEFCATTGYHPQSAIRLFRQEATHHASRQAYAVMEQLYRRVAWYYNFFQPVSQLVSTERAEGKVKKVYDRAQTPYQRLAATKVLDEAQRAKLERLYRSLNPVKLRQEINAWQSRLWELRQPYPVELAERGAGPEEEELGRDDRQGQATASHTPALAD